MQFKLKSVYIYWSRAIDDQCYIQIIQSANYIYL